MNKDVVNNPSHYNSGKIEVIKMIEDQLTAEEYRGYIKGNIIKYIMRERHKNGLEDLKKAQWYLNRLIQKLEQEETKKAKAKAERLSNTVEAVSIGGVHKWKLFNLV